MSTPHLRAFAPTDAPLVFNSWLRSFKAQNDQDDHGLPAWAYWKYYHAAIDRVLERADTRVLCDLDRPDFIFGWICFEKCPTFTVVHYLYVKSAFRKIGLARKMATAAELDLSQVVYTFGGRTARQLSSKADAAEFIPVDKWLDPDATSFKKGKR